MEKSISSDLIRGHIDTIILYSLLDQNKYAQQISDSIAEKSGNTYVINQATLYSSLKRLENLKYVSAYWYDRLDGDSGRRRYFKITDLGRQVVNDNLINWTYSRQIIDKLVDTTPSEPVKTQIIEKIVEVPVPVQSSDQNLSSTEKPEKDDVTSTISKTNDLEVKNEESVQEVNFRLILNELIENNKKANTVKQELLSPIEKEDLISDEEVVDLNKTISKDINRPSNVNNIDFGDLVIKASQEGYKIRISSKDVKKSKGNLPINKLRLFSSLASFLLVLLEVIYFSSTYSNPLNLSVLPFIVIAVGSLIFPIVSLIIYLKDPKYSKNELKVDSLLTSGIVVFNLILFTFAFNLLFGVNLSDPYSFLVYLMTPICLFIDILFYFVIRFIIAKIIQTKPKNAKK